MYLIINSTPVAFDDAVKLCVPLLLPDCASSCRIFCSQMLIFSRYSFCSETKCSLALAQVSLSS